MNAMPHMKKTLAAALLLALGACASTGMGGGELVRKGQTEQPVLFSWKSDDGGISGTMVATVSNATYQGRFFQITHETRGTLITPLWTGWTRGWYDWPYWGVGAYPPHDVSAFLTHYTGKVVANLATADGKHMRCRLHLLAPSSGMSGGGEGECQLQGGGTVNARF